jgi:hypothetical protein
MAKIKAVKGADLVLAVTVYQADGTTPQDLTGRTYVSKIRTSAADTGSPAATFTQAVVSAAAGTMTLTLAAATTATLDTGTTYYWDILETVTSGGAKTVLAAGSTLEFTQDVSAH